MTEARFATKEDFLTNRKLVGFRVEISDSSCTVMQSGIVDIKKDPRNGELRSMYGAIGYVELGVLRLQSESAQHFSGYLVDFAENEAYAKFAAIDAATKKRDAFITELEVKLAKFKQLVPTVIVREKCKC